jgi:HTH-type transcriptional regulator / antitoxin HigA
LEVIFDAEPDTPKGDDATLLEMVIIDYEKGHFPIGEPDPIEAIKFRMEQMNLK